MNTVEAPLSTSARAKTRWTSAAVVIAFFAALWTPLIGMFFGAGEFTSHDENRTLAELPTPAHRDIKWFELGPALTGYLHDHFGFRGTLITAQALLKVKVLAVSSSPDVVIGKQGWLFYAGEKSMDNYRGVRPFTADELPSWLRLVNRRGEWLRRRGIPMILAIVPDKQTVYPEYLPSWIRKVRGQTRLDEFVKAARSKPDMRVLDLRQGLLAKARQAQVYHRTDTHWNGVGVYAAYSEILSEIAKKYPDLEPAVPFSETYTPGKYTTGDLTRMLGLGSVWREIPETIQPRALPTTETKDGDLLVQNPAAVNRRLVLFGDSFLYPLVPYLSQHFRRTVASRSTVLKNDLIDAEQPDLVVFEMAERKLNGPPPRDPVDIMDGSR